MAIFQCLRTTASSGNTHYPIFIGFLDAGSILSVAEAPAFEVDTASSDIAANVVEDPVTEWQRPVNQQVIDSIKTVFNNTGHLMPNPILLSENMIAQAGITVTRQELPGGAQTDIWLIDIDEDSPHKPLWILDGQHRLHGLANSSQSDNPVPFVLLLNNNGHFYSAPFVAKLFAQVTTSAKKLDDLHNEWLTYAFQLDDYAGQQADAHQNAMSAVVELCKRPELEDGTANPFFNRIRFNHFDPNHNDGPSGGGFSYTCVTLKNLLFKHYYSPPSIVPRLTPASLANELASAYIALHQCIPGDHTDTVFFGKPFPGPGQTIMQDAYLAGIMSFLRTHGRPDGETWQDVLNGLAFPDSDWDFSWVTSLNGQDATTSRTIAIMVFDDVFTRRALPESRNESSTIPDFLQGNAAEVRLTFSPVTPKGKASKTDNLVERLTIHSRKTISVGTRTHARLSYSSDNIGRIDVLNSSSPPGQEILYPSFLQKKGIMLGTLTEQAKQVGLVIRLHLYGGNSETSTVTVKWQ